MDECKPLAGGSRALEAFLGNAAHKPKLKRELIDALSGHWARLAASPCGSHVLEACYGAAEQRTRVGSDRYCSPRHRMPFRFSVGSGIEYMVSDPARLIRAVHFENPTYRLGTVRPGRDP